MISVVSISGEQYVVPKMAAAPHFECALDDHEQAFSLSAELARARAYRLTGVRADMQTDREILFGVMYGWLGRAWTLQYLRP